jgi:hypothetical protein
MFLVKLCLKCQRRPRQLQATFSSFKVILAEKKHIHMRAATIRSVQKGGFFAFHSQFDTSTSKKKYTNLKCEQNTHPTSPSRPASPSRTSLGFFFSSSSPSPRRSCPPRPAHQIAKPSLANGDPLHFQPNHLQ